MIRSTSKSRLPLPLRCASGTTRPRIHLPTRPLVSAARRTYATAPSGSKKNRLEPVFTGLLLLGVGLLGYAAYDFYSLLTIWPEEVRDDLRAGVKAKHKGDYELASQYMARAWETVKSLPRELFKEEPYLKISGVAIALADVLEQQNQHDRAFDLYTESVKILQDADGRGELTGPERLRVAAIASKLGEMSKAMGKTPQEEERWLTLAVEEVVKLAKDSQTDDALMGQHSDEQQAVHVELKLPYWATTTDIGAPLENLGSFYARSGKIEYAMPLYLQAISVLIPPPPNESPAEDRCRGAQLMGNLSELILRTSNPNKLQQAEAWAKKGLTVIHNTRQANAHVQIPICEMAYAVALFNVGVLREMAGDKQAAKECYSSGLEHSKSIGMEQGIKEAEAALQRLEDSAS